MTETKELQRIAPAPLANASPGAIARLLAEKPEPSDIDALHRLLDLQLRYDAEAARRAFVEAMATFSENPPAIVRNKKFAAGPLSGKRYADLANVVEQISPALSAVGLSHRWKTGQNAAGAVSVTCIISHRLGHSEETSLSAGADTSGGKNSIQAIASTVSYLERYTLLAALGITPEGDDDDGQSHGQRPPIAEPQAKASGPAPATAPSGDAVFIRQIAMGASGKSVFAELSDGRKVSWFANQEGRDAKMREALENGLPIRITTTTKGNYINLETVEIIYPSEENAEPGARG